jgi:hypothetical protein
MNTTYSFEERLLKWTDRANKIIQNLEETKINFANQIFELVKSRNPFSHERNFSNLWAINLLLTSSKMMADAKEWSQKAIEMYKEESPQLAKMFETFLGMLENPEWMESNRNELYDKTFWLDKEHINSYLILIVEYIRSQIDHKIEFIKTLDEYQILVEDFEQYTKLLEKDPIEDLFKINEIKIKWTELIEIHWKLKMGLSLLIWDALASLFIKFWDKSEMEIAWIHFKKEWIENISKALLKYAKIEKELIKEDSRNL